MTSKDDIKGLVSLSSFVHGSRQGVRIAFAVLTFFTRGAIFMAHQYQASRSKRLVRIPLSWDWSLLLAEIWIIILFSFLNIFPWSLYIKSFRIMQCCGSGMFIPDPNFSIPDPGSKWNPDFQPEKLLLNSLKYDFLPTLAPGSKGQKSIGSRIPDPDLQLCECKFNCRWFDSSFRSFRFRIEEYDLCLYGIFDGFQGCQVADFAKKRLPAEILLGQLVPGTPGT